MTVRHLLLLGLLINGVAFATDAPSRVDSVTVYPEGALVTRVASVELAAGANDIRLNNLVNNLSTSTLQLAVDDVDVRIGQLQLSSEQSRDPADAEVADLQAKIDAKRAEIQAIDDSSRAADLRLKFLDGLTQGYAREALAGGNALGVDELRRVLSLLQSESEAASKFKRDNANRREPLTRDLSLLERQLAELRSGGLSSNALTVSLTSPARRTITLRLTYFQPDAWWRPLYEARIDSDTGELVLMQRAEVLQETDESWDSVKLTLSTSEPGDQMDAPVVYPEFIDIRDPAAAPAAKLDRLRRSAAQSLTADGEMLEQVVVTANRVSRNVGTFAVDYDIPGQTTVSNDLDESVTLDIDRFRFDTELVTVVVPRQSTDAFLQTRFTYNEATPLTGSEMKIFVDGVYTGVSGLPTMLPGTDIELPLGQDRRVTVTAKSQGGESSKSGIISRRKRETTDYLFEITNTRSQPTTVEVRDRVPVSRNDDVDVEIPGEATAATERDIDDQPGLLIWRRELGADETWRVRHIYTVSYPDGKILTR